MVCAASAISSIMVNANVGSKVSFCANTPSSCLPHHSGRRGARGEVISGGRASVDEMKPEEWSKAGQENLQSEVKRLWDDTYNEGHAELFRRVSIHRLRLCRNASQTPSLVLRIAKSFKSDGAGVSG